MPEKQRVVMVLHYMEGKTQAEIAKILGVKEPAVQGRLVRGKEFLQRGLTKRGFAFGAACVTAMLEAGTTRAIPPNRLVIETVKAATASAMAS